MELKYKKALFGIGLGIGLYFALNYLIKKSGALVTPPKPDDKAFKSMDGSEGKYLAKRYDPNHQNLDGSFGATWIGFDDSDIVGFWQKGKVDLGTEIKP